MAIHGTWDAICVMEVDEIRKEGQRFSSEPHSVWRHYPGKGSYAMQIIIHRRNVGSLRRVKALGRLMAFHFRSDVVEKCTLLNLVLIF
eukprot:1828557-Karenia_brevis.AAC.1